MSIVRVTGCKFFLVHIVGFNLPLLIHALTGFALILVRLNKRHPVQAQLASSGVLDVNLNYGKRSLR